MTPSAIRCANWDRGFRRRSLPIGTSLPLAFLGRPSHGTFRYSLRGWDEELKKKIRLYQDGDKISSLNHLLQHTIICSSDYGEGPSRTYSAVHRGCAVNMPFGPATRGDFQNMSTFSAGLAPSPVRCDLFNAYIYCLRQSLWFAIPVRSILLLCSGNVNLFFCVFLQILFLILWGSGSGRSPSPRFSQSPLLMRDTFHEPGQMTAASAFEAMRSLSVLSIQEF